MKGLAQVEVEVAAVLGHARLRMGDVLAMTRGALIALERDGPQSVTLVVGEQPLLKGVLEQSDGGTLRVMVAC